MIDGYLKVAAITPNVRVADVEFNCNEICKCIEEAAGKKVKLMVFPELCITGYTCQDLFFQDRLLEATKEALLKIAKHSQGVDALIFVGLPLSVDAKLYNVAAALCNGEILGIVPKTFLPNYNEFYEARHFYSGRELDTVINIGGRISCLSAMRCRHLELHLSFVKICGCRIRQVLHTVWLERQ